MTIQIKIFIADVFSIATMDSSLKAQDLIVYIKDGSTFSFPLNEIEDISFTKDFRRFQCGVFAATDIDGNTYQTVQIGNQCWMKENLGTTHYRNGAPIEYPGSNLGEWEMNSSGAYAWYENNISWKDQYGALYNWHAVNNSNGLCPVGWHVPSHDEWLQLTDYIGGVASPNGNNLKSCRQVDSPIGEECKTDEHPRWEPDGMHFGTDNYEFSATPGGLRHGYGTFGSIGEHGSWWSSTASHGNYVWFRYLDYNDGKVFSERHHRHFGFSVRCLKD